MAERALPDLRARLQLDTTDLERAQGRARAFSSGLTNALNPAEQSLGRVKQHFQELPGATGAAESGLSRLSGTLGVVHGGFSAVGSLVVGVAGAFRTAGVVGGTALAGMGAAAITYAGHATMVALRTTEMNIALGALAKANNINVAGLNAYVTAIRKQGIEVGVAQNLVAEFTQGHLDLAKASGLARVAQDAAVISGRNSTETLGLLVQGIRTQQIEVLRSAGITISAADAYKRYAQSHHIAETAITETQKQQILLDEVLKQGITIQGAYAAALETPSKQLRSIPRLLNDISLNVGQAFEPALGKVITLGYELAKVFSAATEKGQPLRVILDRAGAALSGLLAPLDRVVPKVKEFLDSLTTDKVDRFLNRVGQLLPLLAGVGAAISALALKSIPIIGPFLAVLDPVVAGLGALTATQPDLRNLAGALGELVATGFGLFQTIAVPAVSALSSAMGPTLIPLIQWTTNVLRELNGNIREGGPWWKTLSETMGAAGFSAGQVSTAIGILHGVFDAGKGIVLGAVNLFQALWEKSDKVVTAALQIARTAWPELQTAGTTLAGSFGEVFSSFGSVTNSIQGVANASQNTTHGIDDTRDAFTRFMTSPSVIQAEVFFAIELPAALLVTVSWLRIAADALALTLIAMSTNIKVTADVMRGDLPAAARDAQAGAAQAQEIMKQDAINTATAIKATNDEMDGTVEQRAEIFRQRMLHLFDTTKAGVIDSHRQMKEESLQQMREMEREAVGGSIIPDMVNSILSWFGNMQAGASSQMLTMARNVINQAGSLAGGVEGNIRSGLTRALQVVHDFAARISGALSTFGVNITIPAVGLAAGGVITPGVGPAGLRPLAAGGVATHQAGVGFVADQPTILVGEGHGREFVIPEDPAHRGNALNLLSQAARALGYIGLQAGGILDWLPNAGAMVQGPTGGFTHAAILAATGGRAWDYMAPNNSPVFAGVPGTVLPGPGSGYGTSISFNMDAGGSVILGHLARILQLGHVAKGVQIALSDNTGFSTGPHLHFEVRGSSMSPGPGGGIDIHALIRAALSPLTAAAHGAANVIPEGWARNIANSIIDKVAANIAGRGDGGPVVPGRVYRVGESGPELFSPGAAGQISPTGAGGSGDRSDDIVNVLISIDGRLAEFTGKPRLAPQLAMQRRG